ncbi:hypothetical protein ACLMJK_005569 [Lecanora helva]
MTSLSDRLPPSTTPYIVASAILCFTAGYFTRQAYTLGLFSTKNKKGSEKKSWPNSYDVTIHPDSSDEELMKQLKGGNRKTTPSSEEEDEDSESERGKVDLKAFEGNREECKLVLVVRTDLGMGKGKIAAQCSHATLACYKHFLRHDPSSVLLKRWESLGQAKIALQVPSEEQMQMLQAQAVSLGLCAQVIHDAGRTQIASGSATVLGVGPGPKSVVDGVTGHLRLL